MNNLQERYYEREYDEVPSSLLINYASRTLEQFTPTPFSPKPYTSSSSVISLHDFTRFGHTNNFQALVQGLTNSNKSATDYIVGVCSAAMLIFCIGLVWGMVIIWLKTRGPKKVGFLAGRLIHPDYIEQPEVVSSSEVRDSGRTLSIIEEEPTSSNHSEFRDSFQDELEMESSETERLLNESNVDIASPLIISNSIDSEIEAAKRDKQFNRLVKAVRISFALCALLVMICGVLFFTKGASSFRASLHTTKHALNLTQDVANRTLALTNAIIDDKDKVLSDVKNVTTLSADDGLFCDHGVGPTAKQIQDGVQTIRHEVNELNRQVNDQVQYFKNDVIELISIINDVDEKLKYGEILFYVSQGIAIAIGIMILGMLVVTWFSAKGISNRCTKISSSAVLWPVFSFFLILFWIVALLFLVTSLSGSDLCVKPDAIIQSGLYYYQEKFTSIVFDHLIYYVSGCTVKPQEEEIEEIRQTMNVALGTVYNLTGIVMNLPLPTLELQCNVTAPVATRVQAISSSLHNTTFNFNQAWIGIQEILACKTFNPIYTTFVHEAVCTQGVGGLTWIFSTSLFLCMFAMLMITFRAAMSPALRPIPQENSSRGMSTSLLSSSGFTLS